MRTFRSLVLDILGWFAIIVSLSSVVLQISRSMGDYPQIEFAFISTAISSFVLAMILWALAKILRNQAMIIEQTKRKQE